LTVIRFCKLSEIYQSGNFFLVIKQEIHWNTYNYDTLKEAVKSNEIIPAQIISKKSDLSG